MPHCSSAKASQIASLHSQIDPLHLRLGTFLHVLEDKVEVLATKVVYQNPPQSEHAKAVLVYQDDTFHDGVTPESPFVPEKISFGGVASKLAAESPNISGCSSGVALESPRAHKLITSAVIDACRDALWSTRIVRESFEQLNHDNKSYDGVASASPVVPMNAHKLITSAASNPCRDALESPRALPENIEQRTHDSKSYDGVASASPVVPSHVSFDGVASRVTLVSPLARKLVRSAILDGCWASLQMPVIQQSLPCVPFFPIMVFTNEPLVTLRRLSMGQRLSKNRTLNR